MDGPRTMIVVSFNQTLKLEDFKLSLAVDSEVNGGSLRPLALLLLLLLLWLLMRFLGLCLICLPSCSASLGSIVQQLHVRDMNSFSRIVSVRFRGLGDHFEGCWRLDILRRLDASENLALCLAVEIDWDCCGLFNLVRYSAGSWKILWDSCSSCRDCGSYFNPTSETHL